MAFTEPWTESDPTDQTFVREVDDHIRRLAQRVRERANVEHYAYLDETGQVNVWKHRAGSAKILSVPSTGLPTPDSSAPGTLAEVTDQKRLARDSGTAWETVRHASQHASAGDDPVTPAAIGAETPDGAQSKVDVGIAAHEAKTTGVHGVGTARVAKSSRTDQWPDWADVQSKPATFPPDAHNHDDRYYTETEADARFLNNTSDAMQGPMEITNPGEGIVLKTPDGTKRFKITVNNNGDLVTTQL